MPGRRGSLGASGVWDGTGGSNDLPANLSLSNRSGNTPAECKATIDIEFVGEFQAMEETALKSLLQKEVVKKKMVAGLYRKAVTIVMALIAKKL